MINKLCPVDGCTQPHAAKVIAAANQPPVYAVPAAAVPPGTPLDDFPTFARAVGIDVMARAITDWSQESAAEMRRLMREHLQTHDVDEFVDTINRLETELAQYEGGVRPHQHR